MRKFAIRVGSGALVPLVFPAHLQLQPSGIFSVQQIVHVYYGHVFAVFISRNEKKSRLYPFAGRLYRIFYERCGGRLFLAHLAALVASRDLPILQIGSTVGTQYCGSKNAGMITL